MVEFRAQDVVAATGGMLLSGKPDSVSSGVSTDTRELHPGELFFALKGPRFDGNLFVKAALGKGAAGVVCSVWIPAETGDAFVVLVDDTTMALGDLAREYRARFDLPVIAITGSVGKTITKEMTAKILSQSRDVLATHLNWNNEIGVPKTIFAVEDHHQAVVIEHAMRAQGEIRRLAEISQPRVGVITNIGLSHVERTGSLEATALAKSELLLMLKPGGCAVLPHDSPHYGFLKRRVGKQATRTLTFGRSLGSEVRAVDVRSSKDGTSFSLVWDSVRCDVDARWIGMHLVDCAAAAAAASLCVGATPDEVSAGLVAFSPPPMRMRALSAPSGAVIIDDCYNASPDSVTAAIEFLDSLEARRRIAVLGSMLELGDYSRTEHLRIGKMVGQSEVDLLLTVGDDGRLFGVGAQSSGMPGDRVHHFEGNPEIVAYLEGKLSAGDAVLVKGSRAMELDRVVSALAGGEGH
jgi:UDP-N-acetylmuramoyl-tripeptide--D-alanyl-D-alanine ligase